MPIKHTSVGLTPHSSAKHCFEVGLCPGRPGFLLSAVPLLTGKSGVGNASVGSRAKSPESTGLGDQWGFRAEQSGARD